MLRVLEGEPESHLAEITDEENFRKDGVVKGAKFCKKVDRIRTRKTSCISFPGLL